MGASSGLEVDPEPSGACRTGYRPCRSGEVARPGETALSRGVVSGGMTNGMTAPATGWRKPPPCTAVRNASETEPGHAGPRPAELGTMTAPPIPLAARHPGCRSASQASARPASGNASSPRLEGEPGCASDGSQEGVGSWGLIPLLPFDRDRLKPTRRHRGAVGPDRHPGPQSCLAC